MDILTRIKLIIPIAVHQQLMAYMQACEIEFSCFVDAEYDEKREVFVLGKVYLLEQEATGATVELDDDAVDKFNFQMIKAGATQLPRCWMHSHVNFQAFFSSTDEATIESLKNDSFNIALVMNKQQEMHAKAYIKASVMGIDDHMVMENLPILVDYQDAKLLASAEKEIGEKVRLVTPLPSRYPMALPKNGKNAYASLSTDPLKAKKFVLDYGLIEEWEPALKEYVYRSPKTGTLFTDPSGTLQYDFDDDDFGGGHHGR